MEKNGDYALTRVVTTTLTLDGQPAPIFTQEIYDLVAKILMDASYLKKRSEVKRMALALMNHPAIGSALRRM